MRGEGIHRGFGEGRWGNLSNEEGEEISGATANLEVVKGTGQVPEIDAEGQDKASDLESPPPSEIEGGRDKAEKYLEEIFREFSGSVHRIKNLNEVALGNKIDFSQGPNDYFYTIDNDKAEEMKTLLNQSISFSGAEAGTKFSEMTGLDGDYLEESKIGFTRKFSVDGKEYMIRFLYLSNQGEQKQGA
ncbi:hypothetical protein KJ785_03795 [Patescibacteria group bacterium]|nr:hypothetical protein [Patescibacteria group bacterium]